MTRLLQLLIGRLPVGWLQLSHSKTRLVAAVFGVTFANLLVLVQLGVIAAMNNVVALTYTPFQADIIISPASANSLFTATNVPRRLLYVALADPDIEAGAPLYLSSFEWTQPDGSSKTLVVYALPRDAEAFAGPALEDQFGSLSTLGQILLDGELLPPNSDIDGEPSAQNPRTFELQGKTVTVVGTLALGGGFGFDGGMATSDETLLNIVGGTSVSTPSQLLLKVRPGADVERVAARLNDRLSNNYVKVRSFDEAIADDVDYMNTQVPMGIIFSIGMIISVLVGIVIVYQVLSTDVAAHLKEYATLKAVGYSQLFFLGVVLEEAVLMAIFGSVPGQILGMGVYAAMASATRLPLGMTLGRAALLFLGTVAACAVSGAMATRRLSSADPAELFA